MKASGRSNRPRPWPAMMGESRPDLACHRHCDGLIAIAATDRAPCADHPVGQSSAGAPTVRVVLPSDSPDPPETEEPSVGTLSPHMDSDDERNYPQFVFAVSDGVCARRAPFNTCPVGSSRLTAINAFRYFVGTSPRQVARSARPAASNLSQNSATAASRTCCSRWSTQPAVTVLPSSAGSEAELSTAQVHDIATVRWPTGHGVRGTLASIHEQRQYRRGSG